MKVRSLHHVRFASPDLARAEQFAIDFGLRTVERTAERLVMRTSGGGDAFCYVAELAPERGFKSLGFAVGDESVLQEAVERHGASPIRALDTPGGGKAVTLTDPEGIAVDLVAGIGEGDGSPQHPALELNLPHRKQRVNLEQARREPGPATLFRLGHVGLYVRDYDRMAAWYRDVLGLLVSDTIHAPGEPEKRFSGFLRVDHGPEPVDHHSIFLAQFGKTDCHHISFEVQDFEAQFMAHSYLESKGWTPNWGVGRHPQGSHVFDVWFNPDRYRFETFSDTSVFDASKQPVNYDVHDVVMDIWTTRSPEPYFAD